MENTTDKIAVVIGASHAGVNLAFNLRKEGWLGTILLFDADPALPYHRPPLSKTYLTSKNSEAQQPLKPMESYKKENIELYLGIWVKKIDRKAKQLSYGEGRAQNYDVLILATGARPFIPDIPRLETTKNVFPLRSLEDVQHIKKALDGSKQKKIVVIGGGYIGLETAASLKKMGAKVTVLEREERVLARVTSPELSAFFTDLHKKHGVKLRTNISVKSIRTVGETQQVLCSDENAYQADVIILGCGIQINIELAQAAGLTLKNGIKVDGICKTNDDSIFAIGDCTFHHNLHYNRYVRLESVQNAVDQAKIAAAAICGKEVVCNSIPWFWSDQYDTKLQMVGLNEGYDEALLRTELENENSFSIWYFNGKTLLAVDAVNNAKAYVIGTKCIKNRLSLDKAKLKNPQIQLKPATIILE